MINDLDRVAYLLHRQRDRAEFLILALSVPLGAAIGILLGLIGGHS